MLSGLGFRVQGLGFRGLRVRVEVVWTRFGIRAVFPTAEACDEQLSRPLLWLETRRLRNLFMSMDLKI